MTDNVAVLEGYTREVHGSSSEHELFLLVRPSTCLDDRFRAWDMDNQEWLMVNGWLFSFEDAS
jgi:hypothetical protein